MKRRGRYFAGVLCLLGLATVCLAGQHEAKQGEAMHATPPEGMTAYYVGLVRRGPKWSAESTPESARIQKEHLAHMGAMAEAGKLVGAGPITDGGDLRGIFIFEVASAAEAKALTDGDPAVETGRLVVDLHRWWGPAGIGDAYAARVKADPKTDVPMVTYQLVFYTRGPKWTPESTPELEQLQKAHLAHIGSMAASGKLVAAGPFVDGGERRGILVFRVDTPEEAKALASEDPAVKHGRLAIEHHPLWAAEGTFPE